MLAAHIRLFSLKRKTQFRFQFPKDGSSDSVSATVPMFLSVTRKRGYN